MRSLQKLVSAILISCILSAVTGQVIANQRPKTGSETQNIHIFSKDVALSKQQFVKIYQKLRQDESFVEIALKRLWLDIYQSLMPAELETKKYLRILVGDNPSSQNPVGSTLCGNGVVDASQQCDDGNTDPNDGCNDFCQLQSPNGQKVSSGVIAAVVIVSSIFVISGIYLAVKYCRKNDEMKSEMKSEIKVEEKIQSQENLSEPSGKNKIVNDLSNK